MTWELAPPSWEAVATLITGVLAVGAALRIGKIQTAIQARQTKLAEDNLKVQLLQSRTDCINEMREISFGWQMHGRLSHEEWRRFYKLLQNSRLLFPKILIIMMDQAVDLSFNINQLYGRHERYRDDGKTDLAKEMREKAYAEEDKLQEIMPRLVNDLEAHSRIEFWDWNQDQIPLH